MALTRAKRVASTVSQVEAALWATDMARAMQLSDDAVGAGAVHPTLLSLTALKRMQAGDNSVALPLLQRARELAPRHIDLLNVLAQCLARLDRPREAVEVFDAALAIAPDARLHFGRALALEDLSELDAARAGFEKSLAMEPGLSEAMARLAVLAVQRGDAQVARDLATRALAINANDQTAGIAFAQAALEQKDMPAAERMVSVLVVNRDLGPVNCAIVLSLAGDILDTRDRIDEAFAAYTESKSILRASYASTMAGLEGARAREERLSDYFHRADPAQWRAQPDDEPRTHVFLVGFPRSGTTLSGTGSGQPSRYPGDGRTHLSHGFSGGIFRRQWRSRQAGGAAGKRAGTMAGPLLAARDRKRDRAVQTGLCRQDAAQCGVPAADRQAVSPREFLLALRDPRDVVLSCFRRRFAMNPGMYEFTTIESTAAYYAAVMQLIAVYRQKLALDLFEARHESLVADFDDEARRLCAFLGVTFQDAMRGFATRAKEQNIDTPSSTQLARGLSDAGVAQWRRYVRPLQPILPVLAPFVARFGYPET